MIVSNCSAKSSAVVGCSYSILFVKTMLGYDVKQVISACPYHNFSVSVGEIDLITLCLTLHGDAMLYGFTIVIVILWVRLLLQLLLEIMNIAPIASCFTNRCTERQCIASNAKNILSSCLPFCVVAK